MNNTTEVTPSDMEAHLERYELDVRQELAATAVNDPAWVQRVVNALIVRERRKINLMQTEGLTARAADKLLTKEGYILPLHSASPRLGGLKATVLRWSRFLSGRSAAIPVRAADHDLKQIQARFRTVRRRAEGPARWRRFGRRSVAWLPVLLVIAVAALAGHALLASQPWPTLTSLKHFAAFPNCSMARLVGLAPAARGQPGYWPQHDADFDGWACEPMPRR